MSDKEGVLCVGFVPERGGKRDKGREGHKKVIPSGPAVV